MSSYSPHDTVVQPPAFLYTPTSTHSRTRMHASTSRTAHRTPHTVVPCSSTVARVVMSGFEQCRTSTGTTPWPCTCRTLASGRWCVGRTRISVIRWRSITAFRPNRIGEYDTYCRTYCSTIHVRSGTSSVMVYPYLVREAMGKRLGKVSCDKYVYTM